MENESALFHKHIYDRYRCSAIQKICGWKEMWKAILALSFAVGVFIIVVE